MTDPVETVELQAFARTVDARSLSRAAADLGVPRATISRRLARLEERLGVRLLRRTTRSLALTDAGDALYRHARIVLDAVAQAEASVRRTDDSVRGELRVSTPPTLPTSFAAMVAAFLTTYPDVRLQMEGSTRYVDLQRDGYDVALRASGALEPGLIARKLASDYVIAVAAPSYLAAHGTPKKPRDLVRHRCIMGFARGESPMTHWPLARGGKVAVAGSLFTNQVPLLLDLARRGHGIAFLPVLLLRKFLVDGSLVHVVPELQAENQFAIVYPARELMPPQVRAFIDAVIAWAPSEFDPHLAQQCRQAATARGTPRRITGRSPRR